METLRLTITLGAVIGFLSVILFVFFRHMGIYKLNEEIINLVVKYCERHPGANDLPTADDLFVSHNKKVWSFKKLTLKNWVNPEILQKLNS